MLQFLQDSDHNNDNNKTYRNYLHRGLCGLQGEITLWKILNKIKTTFKSTHNLQYKIIILHNGSDDNSRLAQWIKMLENIFNP